MSQETVNSTLLGASPEAATRMRKRRNAETRLKAYGIIAIFLAGFALAALLSSVVVSAWGAMSEHYITLTVPLEAEEIDPDGKRDPKALQRANFDGVTKDVLKATFEGVKGRSAKRELYDLVSNGASFELAETVAADPGLVGQTIPFRFLASDVSDLYLKGAYGALNEQAGQGVLTLEKEGKKTLRVRSTQPDFARALAGVKEGLIGQAEALERQAARQDAGAVEFARRAEEADSAEARGEAEEEAQARRAERDRLQGLADSLKARAGGDLGAEKLDETSPSVLIRAGATWIKLVEVDKDTALGEALSPVDVPLAGISDWSLLTTELPEEARKVSDRQIVWLEQLKDAGKIDKVFNTRFFTAGDSREPELAGIWGAAVGSFWTMLVTFCLAFPIGVLAAVYLEEFAPKNRLTDLIEVNINNLAAVPSIIFGLLGLSVIIGFFGVPRSAPLAGGMVMALMTLPTIIIASRASIAAVPPSIREAALGVGASRLQTAFHHVVPLAVPGILTGTIIGMARALGETAPLIMIGMVAFIVDIPEGITGSATVLPVQVFRWADFPERAFEARTSAAICVLLVFLILMNALAVFLRKRFERRW